MAVSQLPFQIAVQEIKQKIVEQQLTSQVSPASTFSWRCRNTLFKLLSGNNVSSQ
jgi:hypothetical protein